MLVGREIVLGRIVAGTARVQTAALNESASIVWHCFDGSGTIDEIAVDIADVFGASVEGVRADVVALVREVGGAGFLAGVREDVIEIGDDVIGIDAAENTFTVGVAFPEFVAEDEQGTLRASAQLRGRRALVVSWSTTCEHCELIADDLAHLVPRLADAGVDVVLLSHATAGFVGLGTPVAYLLDERGRVAAPAALGSTDVIALARRLSTRGDGARKPA